MGQGDNAIQRLTSMGDGFIVHSSLVRVQRRSLCCDIWLCLAGHAVPIVRSGFLVGVTILKTPRSSRSLVDGRPGAFLALHPPRYAAGKRLVLGRRRCAIGLVAELGS